MEHIYSLSRSLCLTFMMLFFPSVLLADEVSVDDAKAKALAFINKSARSKAKAFAKAKASKMLELAYTAKADSMPTLYAFNVNQNDGFVIVSADNATESVLGYADEGRFDYNSIPMNMKNWLKSYSAEILYIKNNGVRTHIVENRSTDYNPIEPLVKTIWGQKQPFSNMCPEIGGSHCVTGCVATAMAQVINYHKWPQGMTSSIPSYTTFAGINVEGLEPTTFDWGNMPLTQAAEENQQQAVSKLMLYCGVSIEMEYGLSESGHYSSRRSVEDALKLFFGYDSNCKNISRTGYSSSKWDSLIYNELKHNRPVLYDGQMEISALEGHAFVVDGYRGEGYYHVNWGWNGYDNGYFKLSGIIPTDTPYPEFPEQIGFDIAQNAMLGLRPSGETYDEDDIFYKDISKVNFPTPELSVSSIEFNKPNKPYWVFTAHVTNNGSQSFGQTVSLNMGGVVFNKYVDIAAGETKDVNFYYPSSGCVSISFNGQNTFSVEYGNTISSFATYWTSPTAGYLYNCSARESIEIPRDVLAVDVRFSNISDLNTIKSSQNPNCLYVLPDGSAIPESLKESQVINSDYIENIKITDGYGFTCPVDVTVGKISYEYKFTEGSDYGTIVLPFEPDGYSPSMPTFYEFNYDSADKAMFNIASSVYSFYPYLISRPEGIDSYTFTAQNINIKSDVCSINYGYNVNFTGNVGNSDNQQYVLKNGVFSNDNDLASSPLRAYFKLKESVSSSVSNMSIAFGESKDYSNQMRVQTSKVYVEPILGGSNVCTRKNSAEEFSVAIACCGEKYNNESDFLFGLGLYKNGRLLNILDKTEFSTRDGYGQGVTLLKFGKNLPDGNYQLKAICKEISQKQFVPAVSADYIYMDAYIKNDTLKLAEHFPESPKSIIITAENNSIFQPAGKPMIVTAKCNSDSIPPIFHWENEGKKVNESQYKIPAESCKFGDFRVCCYYGPLFYTDYNCQGLTDFHITDRIENVLTRCGQNDSRVIPTQACLDYVQKIDRNTDGALAFITWIGKIKNNINKDNGVFYCLIHNDTVMWYPKPLYVGEDGYLASSFDITELPIGEYQIKLVYKTRNDDNAIYLPEASDSLYYNLIINEYEAIAYPSTYSKLPGDVNADQETNFTDVTLVINDLLGYESSDFIRLWSDVNKDSLYTIADVTAIVDIILGREYSSGTYSHQNKEESLALYRTKDNTLSLDMMENFADSVRW